MRCTSLCSAYLRRQTKIFFSCSNIHRISARESLLGNFSKSTFSDSFLFDWMDAQMVSCWETLRSRHSDRDTLIKPILLSVSDRDGLIESSLRHRQVASCLFALEANHKKSDSENLRKTLPALLLSGPTVIFVFVLLDLSRQRCFDAVTHQPILIMKTIHWDFIIGELISMLLSVGELRSSYSPADSFCWLIVYLNWPPDRRTLRHIRAHLSPIGLSSLEGSFFQSFLSTRRWLLVSD